MTGQRPAPIILLNGASSAGKSTLARALQGRLDEPFLRFSLDLFLFTGEVLPRGRDHSERFAWATMRPKVFAGYFGCIAALAHAGNNLIVDHVMESSDQLHSLVNLLAPFNVFYIGVHCPLPELERRERQRGDRRSGDARRDYETVHNFGPYDAEVDATMPPDQNAEMLACAWKAWQPPGVFHS
ncbi:MAG: chloramphenicol phosphotransferase CPT family protein [Roseiarcus sp.]